MKTAFNWTLFFGSFGIYLFTCAPHVPPYRDSGEMASVLITFGIAHAPGYPLYVLLGKLFSIFSVGNMVYRINVFSALAGAISVVVIFQILKKWTSSFPALLCCALYGFSIRFWELASVPEMYTLGILWVTLVLAAAFILENSLLTFFLFGIGLGVRMDTLLLFPLFIFWFWRGLNPLRWMWEFVFGFLGVTIFLFLPIRSFQNPVLDWSNPESLRALFNILTRKSYGGTLDLLSLSYARGENFWVNLKLYFSQFIESFGWWGVTLAGVGILAAFKSNFRLALILSAGFLITGPVFLYLANMPPNPHALAIIQASYLLPDLFLVIFAGFGGALTLRFFPWKWVVFAAALVMLFANAWGNLPKVTKRDNYFARDYTNGVLKSCPPGSVLVLHKDVQLFSLWEAQLLRFQRKDIGIIPTGLASSPWYWDMAGRWGTRRAPAVPVATPAGWEILKKSCGDRPLVIGQETEFLDNPPLITIPSGLLTRIIWDKEPPEIKYPSLLDDFFVFRGRYKYGETPDFFSTDLIGDIARAYQKQAFQFYLHKDWVRAEWNMRRAQSLDGTFPRTVADRAYVYFIQGRFEEANVLHRLAVRKYENLLDTAKDYKALPDVLEGLKKDVAEADVNYGASCDRLGKKDLAKEAFEKAIALKPSPRAYYNLGVAYWGRNWEEAAKNLEMAVRMDPNFPGAISSLLEAKKHINQAYPIQR